MLTAKLIFCIGVISAGQVLLKHGMTGLESVTQAAGSISVWVALLLYGSGMLIWLDILRKMPLHVAYPSMAMSFILVPLTSYLFLSEKPSIYAYIGGFVIMLGIAISYIPVAKD